MILVTGATGNVGRIVAHELREAGAETRLAVRSPTAGEAQEVLFDFTDRATWEQAFDGVRSMLLVRPPAVGNVKRDLFPALAAARKAGVQHVVFLSIQGAEHNKVVPHASVESWLRESGMTWTFIRASFFNQNLLTTHLTDIRDRDEIVVPAGGAPTAFVDAVDVGAVAAAALLDPESHAHRAWTITGPRALTYSHVAEVLSAELGRPIHYRRPGIVAYARHARRRLQMPWAMVAVTVAIYTTARLGLSAGLSDDVRTVLHREPVDFAQFAHRERDTWIPQSPTTRKDAS